MRVLSGPNVLSILISHAPSLPPALIIPVATVWMCDIRHRAHLYHGLVLYCCHVTRTITVFPTLPLPNHTPSLITVLHSSELWLWHADYMFLVSILCLDCFFDPLISQDRTIITPLPRPLTVFWLFYSIVYPMMILLSVSQPTPPCVFDMRPRSPWK